MFATWGYLLWSLIPVAFAIVIGFTGGRSSASLNGLSLQYWYGAPQGDPQGSVFTDPSLHSAIYQTIWLSTVTMLLTVPLGVAFAIALDRWRGRPASSANFLMLVSFVVPEIIIGVALYLFFTYVFTTFRTLGTTPQIIGLTAFQISYPVIVVRARLLSITPDYEEAAMDLGAPPRQAIRRVLLPLLYPAIFASFALVFADVVDDFVTVRYLSSNGSETLSTKIYESLHGSPSPEYNAAATLLLGITIVGGLLIYLVYRRINKGRDTGGAMGLATSI
jgi:spermidine/putrescine transport system permease protein